MNKEDQKIHLLPKIGSIHYSTPAYNYVWKSFGLEDGKEIKGYVMSYFDSKGSAFIAKPVVHIKPEVHPRTGYDQYKPANVSIKLTYYLAVGNEPFQEVKLEEKQIKKAFSRSSFIDSYFLDHKIQNVEDVVKLLKFLEDQGASL